MTLEELFQIIRKMNANHVYIYTGDKHYATTQGMNIRRWFLEHYSFRYNIRGVISVDRMDDTIFPDVEVVFDMFD